MTEPAMTWPTLRHKLGRPRFLWGGSDWSINFRNDYHGCWLWLRLGRLSLLTGYGTYDD